MLYKSHDHHVTQALIRERAVSALRACLCLTAQRETKEAINNTRSYQRAYDEAISGLGEGSSSRDKGSSLSRDDRIHGSLLIINELIMNSAWNDEVTYSILRYTCTLYSVHLHNVYIVHYSILRLLCTMYCIYCTLLRTPIALYHVLYILYITPYSDCSVPCTVYIVHYSILRLLCNVHLYIVHYSILRLLCTMYIYILYITPYSDCSVQCTFIYCTLLHTPIALYHVLYILYITPYSDCSVPCTVYIVHYSVLRLLCTMYCIYCTLLRTPIALYHVLYILYITPYSDCSLYIVHYSILRLLCTMYIYILYITPYSDCSVPCTVYIVHYSILRLLCTMYCIYCTLLHTPIALYHVLYIHITQSRLHKKRTF